MSRHEDGTAKKIDVILHGQETIGSAERSCNIEEMRKIFFTIEDGRYSQKLIDLFGHHRVMNELNEFLQYNFITRSGGGIGITRLIRAMELSNLI
jgi:aspartyl/asparaginyl-tRNA synthetase